MYFVHFFPYLQLISLMAVLCHFLHQTYFQVWSIAYMLIWLSRSLSNFIDCKVPDMKVQGGLLAKLHNKTL